MPLATRLALFVALSVAGVIGVLTFAGAWIAKRQLDGNLRETARVTAVALADDIELRQDPWRREALVPVLQDFMNAGTDLRSIAVFRVENGTAVPVINTSIVAVSPAGVLQRVMATGESAWNEAAPHIALFVEPIHRDDVVTGAVAVAVSLTAVEHLQRTAGLIAAGGAAVAIGATTLLIHLLARRLILDPLSDIRRVMARTRGGDLAARARVARTDEVGEVADGLNAMLTDLEDLQHSLRQRVAAATAQLRERNEQLMRSYESISRLRETAARAQQLAAVGQTMANVAHQIGTPLNLVSGHVQLLRQEITDAGLQRRLRIVEEQTTRMASAVRDLLERAKPDEERRPIRAGAVLATIGEAMRVRLAASGVTLDLLIGETVPHVLANEAQLELALLNLVTNALDAMPDGGTVTLAAAHVREGVVLRVHDTGQGIPADVLPRIFEPWVTTKGAAHGTGLGLSITRDVITSLGGTIAVATSPGSGTTFTITLPAIESVQRAS